MSVEAQFQTIIEPFVIKSVQPIRMTTRAEREQCVKAAHYNLFNLKSQDIMLDLFTDSGTAAMSTIQWAALMKGDEAYAGSESFQRLEATAKRIFGFRHIIPVHQGRAGERIFSAVMCNEGDVVPNNNHFDTTRANLEYRGATAVDLVIEEGLDPQSLHPFKGNMDVGKLKDLIAEVGAETMPLCTIEHTYQMAGRCVQ